MATDDRVASLGAMVEYKDIEVRLASMGAMVEYKDLEVRVASLGIMIEYYIPTGRIQGPAAQMMG